MDIFFSGCEYNLEVLDHKIMKRDVGIGYATMRKIHYNVMRFRDTLALDEAEVLAGRYRSLSGRYYVLHDPQKAKQLTLYSTITALQSHGDRKMLIMYQINKVKSGILLQKYN